MFYLGVASDRMVTGDMCPGSSTVSIRFGPRIDLLGWRTVKPPVAGPQSLSAGTCLQTQQSTFQLQGVGHDAAPSEPGLTSLSYAARIRRSARGSAGAQHPVALCRCRHDSQAKPVTNSTKPPRARNDICASNRDLSMGQGHLPNLARHPLG